MDLFFYHAIISTIVYANWTINDCAVVNTSICDEIFNQALEQIGVIYQQKKRDISSENQPSLDPDDLYQDFCTGNGTLDFAVNQGYPNACYPIGNQVSDYLNRKDVQDVIGSVHVVWTECANINYDVSYDSLIPYYESFFMDRPDLNILIYSGDVDVYTVPFGITQYCLLELEEVPVLTWTPWFVNGATAGYVEQYERYTYATVKGGGHETPQYQPLTSYNLIQRFITGSDLVGESPKPLSRPSAKTQARILLEYMRGFNL